MWGVQVQSHFDKMCIALPQAETNVRMLHSQGKYIAFGIFPGPKTTNGINPLVASPRATRGPSPCQVFPAPTISHKSTHTHTHTRALSLDFPLKNVK